MTREKAKDAELQKLITDAVDKAVQTALLKPLEEMQKVVAKYQKELEEERTINARQRDELKELKVAVNDLQQCSRLSYLRVFGVGVSEDEVNRVGQDKAVTSKVYEKILEPLLRGAKSRGLIPTVPSLDSVLTEGFRSGRPSEDEQGRSIPPPLVVKFASKQIRDAVLRCKKEFMPSPTHADKAAGVKRYALVEDLTRPTHQLFRALVDDKRVGAVWTVDGKIRFTKCDDESKKIHKVFSPFATVEDLMKKKRTVLFFIVAFGTTVSFPFQHAEIWQHCLSDM